MTSTHVPPPFHGVFPVAPTPFSESGDVDFQSQGRVLDCMVDQGADGVIRSDATRHPIAPLPPATRTALLELAREVDPVVLRWGR